jgi:putative nucleotidyltransferase with HDIG domain
MTQALLQFPAGKHPFDHVPIKRVIEIARGQKIKVFLVGGYIRDILINAQRPDSVRLDAKDFDYAVTGAKAFSFAKELASELNGHFVPLDQGNDTARVVLPDGTVLDFAGCVGGDIESDVHRRDFTINGLYWDPERPEVVNDLVGGLEDIRNSIVRASAEDVLPTDPLRILRAYRFAATLNFAIDPLTLTWLARHQRMLAYVAPERVNYELFITFASRQMGKLLVDMGESGLLETIFPELTATRNVTGNAFHHLGLFEHSLQTVLETERVLGKRPDWPATNLDEELSFAVTRLAATRIACLLHDIGKPTTWAITPDGKHTFIGHDRLGAEMVTVIAERQKWARPVERFVVKLVKWHLRPGQLFHQGAPTDKAIHRFYRQAGRDLPELMLLALGDLGATRGPAMQGGKNEALGDLLVELLNGYNVFIEESQRIPKLLNGDEIMQLLNLKPGPLVGELLLALAEAQEFKEVSNRAEAERFVRELYRQKG